MRRNCGNCAHGSNEDEATVKCDLSGERREKFVVRGCWKRREKK